MTRLPRSVRFSALVLLTAPLSAQIQIQFEQQNLVDWPGTDPSPSSVTRAVASDLTGNGTPDVVVLADGIAYMAHDAAYHSALLAIPAAAIDIAVIPGGGTPTGPVDALAVLTPTALKKCVYNQYTAAFTLTTIAAYDWAGATRVQSRDMNAYGAADYVGVRTNGQGEMRRVLIREDSAGGTIEASFEAFGTTITDLLLVEWDGDAEAEIALLTSYGVELYEHTGSLIAKSRASIPGNDAFAAVRLRQSNTDGFAWVRPVAGSQQLMVLKRGGPTTILQYPQFLLPFSNACSIAAADFDADDDSDIVITRLDDYAPYWYRNESDVAPLTALFTTDSLGGGEIQVAGSLLDQEVSNNVSQPIFADIDRDGVPDLVVPVPTASPASLDVLKGVLSTYFDSGDLYKASTMPAWTAGGPSYRTLTLNIEFDKIEAGATHIDLVVWRQPDFSVVPQTYPEGLAYRWHEFPVAIDQGTSFPYLGYSIDIRLDGCTACDFANDFWFEIRQVEKTAPPYDSWATYAAGFTTDYADFANMTPTGALTPAVTPCVFLCEGAPTCDGYGGTTPMPRIIQRRYIPAFDPTDPPKLPVSGPTAPVQVVPYVIEEEGG